MATPVSPIANGEVLLHVGLHKTGTTALQVALADARLDLEQHGVCYPGTSTYQHRAIMGGAGKAYGWQDRGAKEVPRKTWDALVSQSRFKGRTIISSEFLDNVEADVAARMVADLGGPQRVRVVVTLRSIGAILPSAWQQRLKSGYAAPYSQFLTTIFAEQRSKRAERFWFRHDQVEQLRRWADIVGNDRTYAVIIPDGDRTAIFDAFEGLLALPAGFLAKREVAVANRSMTAGEAEFLRRLNKEVADELTWDQYATKVREGIVLTMVETRKPPAEEPRIQTPAWAADQAAAYGQRFAEGVAALGVHVIGDPAALAKRPRSAPYRRARSMPLDAAVAAAAGLVRYETKPATAGRRQAWRVLTRRGGRDDTVREDADET